MPIYEYACVACSAEFEELVSLSAADDVACTACGSTRVERQLSSFQRVRAGGGGGEPALAAAPARAGGCCGGGCGCG